MKKPKIGDYKIDAKMNPSTLTLEILIDPTPVVLVEDAEYVQKMIQDRLSDLLMQLSSDALIYAVKTRIRQVLDVLIQEGRIYPSWYSSKAGFGYYNGAPPPEEPVKPIYDTYGEEYAPPLGDYGYYGYQEAVFKAANKKKVVQKEASSLDDTSKFLEFLNENLYGGSPSKKSAAPQKEEGPSAPSLEYVRKLDLD